MRAKMTMYAASCAIAAVLAGAVAEPSLAHHPGDRLDEVMGDKERFFQVIDKPAPEFELRDAEGRMLRLADFRDKVLVLHFVYAACPDVCPLHAERIAEVQDMINQTAMKDRVQFITITTDPKNDTGSVLHDYGPAHGLKSENWVFLTTLPDQREDTTRKLAQAYGHSFTKAEDGYQAHGVVTHVIDRNGRWAANFHGLRFAPINLVQYINGLTNAAQTPKRPSPNLWDRMKDLF